MANLPFKLGDWLVLCDRCKFKRHASQTLETWDGFRVCKPTVKQGCWEPRHPQDFIKPVKEDQVVPFSRPRPTNQFTTVDYIASTVGVQETTIPSGHFNSTDPND